MSYYDQRANYALNGRGFALLRDAATLSYVGGTILFTWQ